MTRVAFKGAVMDFLAQGHGRLNDHMGAIQEIRDSAAPLGDGNGIPNRQAHFSSPHQLGDGHQYGDIFLSTRADHGVRIRPESRHLLKREAVSPGQCEHIPCQSLRAKPRRIGHVSRYLGNHVPSGPDHPTVVVHIHRHFIFIGFQLVQWE